MILCSTPLCTSTSTARSSKGGPRGLLGGGCHLWGRGTAAGRGLEVNHGAGAWWRMEVGGGLWGNGGLEDKGWGWTTGQWHGHGAFRKAVGQGLEKGKGVSIVSEAVGLGLKAGLGQGHGHGAPGKAVGQGLERSHGALHKAVEQGLETGHRAGTKL